LWQHVTPTLHKVTDSDYRKFVS